MKTIAKILKKIISFALDAIGCVLIGLSLAAALLLFLLFLIPTIAVGTVTTLGILCLTTAMDIDLAEIPKIVKRRDK